MFGDSHLKRIRKDLFNKSVSTGKSQFNEFSGTTTRRLNHFVTPILDEERPDTVLIHVGCNDITPKTYRDLKPGVIANEIIDIGKKCMNYGTKKLFISSILIKKQSSLTKIINQVNDILKDLCLINSFIFIDNSEIKRDMLWKDGIDLNDQGIYMFASNFVDYLNANAN